MQTTQRKINKVYIYFTLLLTLIAVGCTSGEFKISGRFIGGDGTVAYLEEVGSSENRVIDSALLSPKGEFAFKVTPRGEHHKIYNLVYDYATIPLFAAPGDKITVNSVGNIARNYTLEGSDESELVRQFYQEYINSIAHLDKIAIEYGDESISEERRTALAKTYTAEYNSIKRAQLEFIIENKASLAAVYALYQRLPNDSYLFSGSSDVIYYRTVAEALEENYPESPYRKNIQADIDQFDAINHINNNIQTLGFPDLELSDMLGEKQKLSALEGQVILLDFWSAQLGSSNRNNAELKELYAKYHDKGFEVYQVGIDNSKSMWINTIQEQGLPWISVSDLMGNRSKTLSLYNVTALPANFIINRQGDIIARDVYGDRLENLIKAQVAQ